MGGPQLGRNWKRDFNAGRRAAAGAPAAGARPHKFASDTEGQREGIDVQQAGGAPLLHKMAGRMALIRRTIQRRPVLQRAHDPWLGPLKATRGTHPVPPCRLTAPDWTTLSYTNGAHAHSSTHTVMPRSAHSSRKRWGMSDPGEKTGQGGGEARLPAPCADRTTWPPYQTAWLGWDGQA